MNNRFNHIPCFDDLRDAVRARPRRRGNTIVIAGVTLALLMALVSLAVDFGRVQVVKHELSRAADAAALAGASGVLDNTYYSKAYAAAADNLADGASIQLKKHEVILGTWANGTFSPGGSSPNAVKVIAQRANDTAVPLVFARAVGMN